MDKTHDGAETQRLILARKMVPAVPPKCKRLTPREGYKEM